MRGYKYRDIKRRMIKCRRMDLKKPFKRFWRQGKVSWLRMRPWEPSASDSNRWESSPPRRAGVLTVNCSLARPVYLNSLAASSCMTRPFDKKTAGRFR